ncbi:splicing factor 3B subunit 2 [Frankliniella occidentalis]|uniref:Splicing factor 3B subunit 2 n=1 Tax=Frankliniella occidentalis TaxID=133901 RepID=A0A9C6XT72_FRAOC|nr:splicing factor 3B subunit 2 [Frankliniella occidentalis]
MDEPPPPGGEIPGLMMVDHMMPPGTGPYGMADMGPPGMMTAPPPPSLGMTMPPGDEAYESLLPPGVEDDDTPMAPPPPSFIREGSPEDDLRLPQALEQALAYKNQRAQALGVDEDDFNQIDKEYDIPEAPPAPVISQDDDYDEEEDNDDSNKISKEGKLTKEEMRINKNKRKKKKKKQNKQTQRIQKQEQELKESEREKTDEETGEKDVDVEIEYIQEVLGLNDLDPMYRHFAKVFETFRITEPDNQVKLEEIKEEPVVEFKKAPKPIDEYDDEEDEEKKQDEKKKLSKRKLKKLTRLSVAELKQLVSRPDVVEMHDVTARDPKLLVQLKAHRNTVPVPRHWCFKRKYLQGKRGIEKPPFDLPEFIKKTGIMEMRAALQEKEDQRTLKAKMRERSRPKLGKIDIDYQKLHDAFFKWQTKPRMTIHGDLYYEGKEFETRLKEKKPGDLSDDLRTALGMPVGSSAHKVPPPWLIAMQRYGPPPSYPNLKIPGLNAPIPDNCSFGYHAGGWGKPPVDESGKALYGDVFGQQNRDYQNDALEEEVDRAIWGELESESEEEESEEEESEAEEEGEDQTGLVTPAEGLVTPSGMASIPTGLETPEIIELRKRKIESEMDGGDTPAQLYQVLPEKRVDRVSGAMMASTHIYDMAGTSAPREGVPIVQPRGRVQLPGMSDQAVELALDPSELDLVDTEAMKARYEQQIRELSHLQKEDHSDMLADHLARQKNKRKRQQTQSDKQTKKYKEFKF